MLSEGTATRIHGDISDVQSVASGKNQKTGIRIYSHATFYLSFSRHSLYVSSWVTPDTKYTIHPPPTTTTLKFSTLLLTSFSGQY